jgi:Icc protein
MIRNDGADGKKYIRDSYESEYPRPNHFLIHISDTHIIASDEHGLYGSTVYSFDYLQALFRRLRGTQLRPDAIIFTGDLADMGEPEAYAKIRGLVEPVAAEMGTKVLWVMGNHDNRAAFREQLLDQAPSLETIDEVHWFGGLRLIVLDSTVHGAHWGEVSQRQLDWLSAELATPAPEGTILAMHHPPIPSVIKSAISVELTEQKALAAVLRGTDVRSIIAGHLHYSTNALFAGIPVSVASATCYTQDLNIPDGALRPRDGGQTFNFVHVYDETVVHSVVPLGNYPVLKEVSAKKMKRDLKISGFSGYPKSTVSNAS